MPNLLTVEGGALFSDLDPKTIGPKNCVQRLNIRRRDDAEIPFGGWSNFSYKSIDDIVTMKEAVRPNGDKLIFGFTKSAVYYFLVLKSDRNPNEIGGWMLLEDGFSESDSWELQDFNGYTVVNNRIDLPRVYDWDEKKLTPMYELREAGVASVGTIFTYKDFLLLIDVTEIKASELKSWMNDADSPYGIVPDSLTTRTQFRVIGSDSPLRFRLSIGASLKADTKEMIIDFPCKSIAVGDLLSFTESVEDNDGVTVLHSGLVEKVDGRRITLDSAPAAAATGFAVRSDYTEQIVWYDDLQGDGTPLLRAFNLGGFCVIVRDNAILAGSITDSVDAPILFEEVYRGQMAPTNYNLICTIGNRAIVYYSRGLWYKFDFVTRRPEEIATFKSNQSLFENAIEGKAYAFESKSEVWIIMPDTTVVWDYSADMMTVLDASLRSAAAVTIDGVSKDSILLAPNGSAALFDEAMTLRDGEEYSSEISYGYIGDAGTGRDIALRRHIIVGDGNFQLTLSRPNGETPVQNVAVAAGGMVRLYLRGEWIQETIKILPNSRLVSREIEMGSIPNALRSYGIH